MAHLTRDVLELMQQEAGLHLSGLKVDGGAAYLAGLAVGYWDGPEDVTWNWALDRTFEPSMATAERDRLYAAWKKAVARSLDWADR